MSAFRGKSYRSAVGDIAGLLYSNFKTTTTPRAIMIIGYFEPCISGVSK